MNADPTPFVTDAELWNGLTRLFGQPLPLEGAQVVLSEAEAPGAGGMPAWEAKFVSPAVIVLDTFPFDVFAKTPLTLDEVAGLPPPLGDALCDAALAKLRATLPKAMNAQLNDLKRVADVPDMPVWLRAEVHVADGKSSVLRIGTTRADIASAMQILGGTDTATGVAKVPSPVIEGITVAFDPCFASLPMALGQLQSLRPGDAILPPISADARVLRSAHFDINLSRDATQETPAWAVVSAQMTDENAAPAAADEGLVPMDEMPVTLSFATDTRDVPLKEVYGMTPGSVVALDLADLETGLPVRILVNGAQVGKGHLIQIDDQIAVRVDTMSGAKAG